MSSGYRYSRRHDSSRAGSASFSANSWMVGIAGEPGLAGLRGKVIVEFAADDREQPVAKCAAVGIVLVFRNGLGDGLQNVLANITGCGLAQTSLAAKPENQRRVNGDELRPRGMIIGIAQANQ
jgi:hypothetical protein